MSEHLPLDVTLKRPHTQRGVERQQALLMTAYRLFLEHGYEKVCLDDIVQQAGGSKASIYKYFGNKEGLLFAICDYHFSQRLNGLYLPFSPEQDLREYLIQILHNTYLLTQHSDHIAFFHLILNQSKPNPTLTTYLHQKWNKEVQQHIANILQTAHQQGVIHCPNPTFSSLFFWGTLHHALWNGILNVKPQIEIDPLAYIAYCVDCFLAGHQCS